jgi:two-component system OmpR family response regulator
VRIVLVEDNLQLANSVAEGLGEDGYAVEVVDTAAKALARGLRRDLDLMVLDLGLPDRDGIEVLRELRGAHIQVPVLVLTARDAIDSRVAALEAGADDYLVKPFAGSELLARISALGRRQPISETITKLAVADLEMDLLKRTVTRAGTRIELQQQEYKLLEYLMLHAGEIVTRTMLLENIWSFHFDPGTNLIESHISRLRAKIDRGFDLELIQTVRGAGYRMRGDD